jgi:hypothetical protein
MIDWRVVSAVDIPVSADVEGDFADGRGGTGAVERAGRTRGAAGTGSWRSRAWPG